MNRRFIGSDRISALSDGVFAIAMTLLVLDLRPPEVSSLADPRVFAAGLVEQLPRFLSWLLSFAILCRLWTVQYDLLTSQDDQGRGFVVWTFVFLGAVSFIPFPTSLLAEHPDQLLSVLVFSATYVVAALAVGGMRHSLDQDATLDEAAPARHRLSRAMLLILMTAALSCLLALINPRLGAFVWFSYPFTGGMVRRQEQRAAARL